MDFSFFRSFGIVAVLALASCSGLKERGEESKQMVNPRTVNKLEATYKNPFSEGTYAHFVARKDYPKTYDTYRNDALLNKQGVQEKMIKICLKEQRGRYYVDGQVAMDFPVSTGIKKFPTNPGEYKVLEKSVDHESNLYGKIFNAEGKCINGNAEITDPVPEGGRFEGSKMPYWQRLTGAGLGLHVGKVRRSPASHGCVRLQRETAKTLYDQTKVGSRVVISEELESEATSLSVAMPSK
jgi:lipoprotein-anchoring transpeptidase ErfK/SrfK